MNWQKLIRGILLSFVFVSFFGFIIFGMHRFSSGDPEIFLLKTSPASAFDSISDSIGLSAIPVENKNLEDEKPFKNSQAADLEIGANSAIVFEIRSDGSEKILFSKNSEQRLPVASISKLMTAAIVLENYDLSKKIEISGTAASQESGGLLKPGQSFAAKDLLYDMLIESNNSAGYAFSEAMGTDNFVKLMNAKAQEIGLFNTDFKDATGVAELNYSTAEDLARMVYYMSKQHPLILQITTIPEFNLSNYNGVFHYKALNTNKLLAEPSAWQKRIVGGKTGNGDKAGECLVLVLNSPDNKGLISAVLLNSQNRFEEMKKMIDWTDAAYSW